MSKPRHSKERIAGMSNIKSFAIFDFLHFRHKCCLRASYVFFCHFQGRNPRLQYFRCYFGKSILHRATQKPGKSLDVTGLILTYVLTLIFSKNCLECMKVISKDYFSGSWYIHGGLYHTLVLSEA